MPCGVFLKITYMWLGCKASQFFQLWNIFEKLKILEIFLVPKNVQGGVVGFYIWTLQEMASLEFTNLIQKTLL